MTIRVRLKADKATVRFGNRMDEQYFVHTMIIARDRVGQHPEVSVRGRDKREMLPLATVPIAKVGVSPGKMKGVEKKTIEVEDAEKKIKKI